MSKCALCKEPLLPLDKENRFSRCPRCRAVYNRQAELRSYEEDYFSSEYENQYGRTYEADKEIIQKRMQYRLSVAQKYLSTGKSLLELGSAAGYFLELARNHGFASTEGWEISASMASLANRSGLTTRQGEFYSLFRQWKQAGQAPFDLVAAFYVIEHFNDHSAFWEAVSALTAPQGFLLLALPSTFGPLFYFQRDNWLKSHPSDHFIDYSPYTMKKIASRYHFELVHIETEGIHPDRFPGGRLPLVSALLKPAYRFIQKKYTFSDTFFCLLQKKAR